MTDAEREDVLRALIENHVRHTDDCRKAARLWHESHRGFCTCGLESLLAVMLAGRTEPRTCWHSKGCGNSQCAFCYVPPVAELRTEPAKVNTPERSYGDEPHKW